MNYSSGVYFLLYERKSTMTQYKAKHNIIELAFCLERHYCFHSVRPPSSPGISFIKQYFYAKHGVYLRDESIPMLFITMLQKNSVKYS